MKSLNILPEEVTADWNILSVWADALEYWDNKFASGSEHFDNGIIEVKIKNKETGVEKFLCLFGGANYREKDVAVLMVGDTNDYWRESWRKNGSLAESDKESMSEENRLLAEYFENGFDEEGRFDFSEAYDHAFELKQQNPDFIYLTISKKVDTLTEKDLEEATALVAKIEKALGKKRKYTTYDVWKDPDTGGEISIESGSMAEASTPINEDGKDMLYVRTDIKMVYIDKE